MSFEYPRDSSLVKKETEFNESEIKLAKKLALFWKEEREQQDMPFISNWEDMRDDWKACFLNQARQLIIFEGFDLG